MEALFRTKGSMTVWEKGRRQSPINQLAFGILE